MKPLVSVGRETESGHMKASICEGKACGEEGALQTDTGAGTRGGGRAWLLKGERWLKTASSAHESSQDLILLGESRKGHGALPIGCISQGGGRNQSCIKVKT